MAAWSEHGLGEFVGSTYASLRKGSSAALQSLEQKSMRRFVR
jgi:hypothetical protein